MAFKNENTDKNFMSFTTSYTTTHSHSHHRNNPPNSTTQQQPTQTPRHKWATFTYIGKETLYITNVLKHTGLRIAFRMNNTTDNLLKQRGPIPDKIFIIRCLQINLPRLPKALCGPDWKAVLHSLQKTQECLLPQQPYFQFCTTPPGQCTRLWPHRQHNASITSPK